MRWFGKNPAQEGDSWRERREKEKQPANREILIALMTTFADLRLSTHIIFDEDSAKRANVMYARIYNALRSIAAETIFQSHDSDEIIGIALHRSETESHEAQNMRDAISHIKDWKKKISNPSEVIKKIGRDIHESQFAKITGYVMWVLGIDEVIGFLPKGQKKKPLYIGSYVRYEKHGGETGKGQIQKFSDITSVMKAPLSHAMIVYDKERDEEISLCFNDIKQVYDC